MKPFKKTVLVLVAVFVVIQFIRPAHNTNNQVLPTDLAKVVAVPNSVLGLMQNACYDCHSNDTKYPWYSNLQPMAWMMANHIKHGKEKLNFSEFGTYTGRRQISKLREIANQIKDREMPIASYSMMHKNARLSKEQKDMIMDWANGTADSLSTNN